MDCFKLTSDPIIRDDPAKRSASFHHSSAKHFSFHHGEGFILRQLATAMDCSSDAAANHLVAATQALSACLPQIVWANFHRGIAGHACAIAAAIGADRG